MRSNFRPFSNKNVHIWDHFFPLLFPKDSKSVKILDIRLREVGAKRLLNGSSKVKKWRRKNFFCAAILDNFQTKMLISETTSFRYFFPRIGFFLDLLKNVFGFLNFFRFLNFCIFFGIFLFFGIFFKVTKVTTKSYQGYYWTPKIAKNVPKQHIKLVFSRKAKRASAEGWSPPQELEVGPFILCWLIFFALISYYFPLITAFEVTLITPFTVFINFNFLLSYVIPYSFLLSRDATAIASIWWC